MSAVDHFAEAVARTTAGDGSDERRDRIVNALREPRVAAHLWCAGILLEDPDLDDEYRIDAARLALDQSIKVVADAVMVVVSEDHP